MAQNKIHEQVLKVKTVKDKAVGKIPGADGAYSDHDHEGFAGKASFTKWMLTSIQKEMSARESSLCTNCAGCGLPKLEGF